MYSISEVRQGISSPNLIARELNRKYYGVCNSRGYNTSGIDIFEEDWDTLVILDACRYDMFKEQNTIPGELKRQISRGSNTSEFVRANFDGKELLDTVYTTTTPKLAENQNRGDVDVTLHKVVDLWNTDYWDHDLGTVPPDTMTDVAIDTIESYPDKRHIIHYLQPHYPFLNSDVDKGTKGVQEDEDGFDIWGELFRNNLDISADNIWAAYRENLNIVLESVERLLDTISGKTVITSDHGNMVNERSSPIPIREWGHPSQTYTEQLVAVPWLVYTDGNRRTIKKEKPNQTESYDSEVVDDRLKDLGYL